MSFADPLLKYLEEQEMMPIHIKLRGKIREDFPSTRIATCGNFVEQYLYSVSSFSRKGMKIPDEISIEPSKVIAVEILTSGPYRFEIEKNGAITVYHTEEMREEQKESLKKAAAELKYSSIKFMETNIVA